MAWYTAVRGWARRGFFRFLERVAESDDAKRLTASMLDGLLCRQASLGLDPKAAPVGGKYPEVGRASPPPPEVPAQRPIFISGRFRCGSTLLWNIFRHVQGCTAYYEPFNERRWFDRSSRGAHVDASHRGIDDYWREYDGLEELESYYTPDWTERRLLMGADAWAPAMQRYLLLLLESARDRPVLQFNRVDFRLPWLRARFPQARIIHLYRHPRDQWCSSLLDDMSFPREGRMQDFASVDRFYLTPWARDLSYHFPFLDPGIEQHPYRVFYYIWRLSYLFGVRYAHASVAYEDLLDEPVPTLKALFESLHIEDSRLDALAALVEPTDRPAWPAYADDAWFKAHETACEDVLADFFSAPGPQGRHAGSTAAGRPWSRA